MTTLQKNNLSRIMQLSEKFSKLSVEERRSRLVQMELLTVEEMDILKQQSVLPNELINHLIENAIGAFSVPLGIAVGFRIDDQDFVIPMATEETSVIAAACKTAKWIREKGTLTTKNVSQLAIGQIQIPRVNDCDQLYQIIQNHKDNLIKKANETVAANLAKRNGGVQNIDVRCLPRGDGEQMGIIHIFVDTCDAMGANIINQICEFLKHDIEALTNEEVGMCILSNLADTKLTQANIVIHNINETVGKAIEEASLFAQIDNYRAATNNKGIMNGIDSVLIATGNDWRAVEAGLHAYASSSGRYTSISRWFMKDKDLHGVMIAPIVVGIVGGVTRLHPVAKLCLKMLKVTSAMDLARIVAAVGLVQNLGALNALVTEGIVKGHMKLHIPNLAMAVGASHEEIPILKRYLAEHLMKHGHVTEGDARLFVTQIRTQKNNK